MQLEDEESKTLLLIASLLKRNNLSATYLAFQVFNFIFPVLIILKANLPERNPTFD